MSQRNFGSAKKGLLKKNLTLKYNSIHQKTSAATFIRKNNPAYIQ